MLDRKSKKPTIIFFGTPKFAAIIFYKLILSKFKPKALFTQPDKKIGRKQILTSPPTKEIAKKFNIPTFQFQDINQEKAVKQIKKMQPDIIIVAAFGQIISKQILKLPKYGCINLHPSLLPKYRGPAPIQSAILNGDKETGVTIMKMDTKMDHGPIYAQRKITIDKKETSETLTIKLANLSAKLLLDTLPEIITGSLKPIPQEDQKATYTKILKKEDGKINWQDTAENIERKIRAFTPWPKTYTFLPENLKKIRMQILRAKILKQDYSKIKKPGILFQEDDKLVVCCRKDYLVLEKIKLEGKKEISGKEFLQGYQKFLNRQLTS